MTGASTRRIHVDSRKWPDRPHWHYDMRLLGEDEHGVWLHAPAGTIAQRGPEPPFPLRIGFVTLVPVDRWWVVEFNRLHPKRTVYVNIGTPPRWHGDRVTQVDLDLDVVRRLDGTVQLMDEDEFHDHRVRFSYPPDLVTDAERAAELAADLLQRRAEPFDLAPERWLDLAGDC